MSDEIKKVESLDLSLEENCWNELISIKNSVDETELENLKSYLKEFPEEKQNLVNSFKEEFGLLDTKNKLKQMTIELLKKLGVSVED